MTNQAITPYILVGVDGSPAALRAVNWAADEAHRRGLPLVLANVVDPGDLAHRAAVGTSDSTFATPETFGREALAAAEQRVAKRHPSVSTRAVEKTGSPAPALIELSCDAYLTVVGATGLGGFSSILLGTVALALVTNGHSPVAVIRGAGEIGAIPRTGPVVLGVDGSEFSEPAIAWAFDEASRRSAVLTAIHAWTAYPNAYAQSYALASGIDYDAEEVEHRALLTERLAGWGEKYPDVRVRPMMVSGSASDVLLDHTADAQLVVVGSRGRGEVAGAVFGSVSRMLIHHAPCPVLIARNHPTHRAV
ncbi:universal stress protein [Tsukamurella soli]|uniref:Universal stress protein n=1 Tax=Tsukamurella soli TaxID=644556 RepID=A0ABP8JPK2_9ACTN